MRFSKITLFLAVYIIISASFAQQAWFFLKALLGIKILLFLFILAYAGIILVALSKKIKSASSFKQIILFSIIYTWGFIFAWRQPYPAEKTHVLEYGLLAWLSMRDLTDPSESFSYYSSPMGHPEAQRAEGSHKLRNVLSALAFILIIGSLDEGFQKLLPWRVFEIRDIITNVLSGAFGIALFILR